MTDRLLRAMVVAGLMLLAAALSGCIVEGRGGGWCYNHPYRC